MTHKNLPALNKYTSQTQYEALKVIDETKSIVQIVQNGQSSKTLGALVRSMWIKQKDYTDDKGVLREGWFVTEEGRQAMNIFSEKELLRIAEEERAKVNVDKFRQACINYRELAEKTLPYIDVLKLQLAKAQEKLGEAEKELKSRSCFISTYEVKSVLHESNIRKYFDSRY